MQTVSNYSNQPPSADDDSYEVTYFKSLFTDYQVQEANAAALQTLLEIDQSQTSLLLVEMPIPEGMYSLFGAGVEDYEEFLGFVSEKTAASNIPLITTNRRGLIPEDGWADYSHLNSGGAQRFSFWLGEQVAGLFPENQGDSE